jgi:hypothetical protein
MLERAKKLFPFADLQLKTIEEVISSEIPLIEPGFDYVIYELELGDMKFYQTGEPNQAPKAAKVHELKDLSTNFRLLPKTSIVDAVTEYLKEGKSQLGRYVDFLHNQDQVDRVVKFYEEHQSGSINVFKYHKMANDTLKRYPRAEYGEYYTYGY